MKNLFPLFLLLQLLWVVSCNNVDQKLVDQIDETVNAMQAYTGDFDMNTQGIISFSKLVDEAPEALKSDTSSGFAALREKVTSFLVKQEATVAEFKQVLSDLQKTGAEYSAGKISTEDARMKHETLSARLVSIKDLLALVGTLNDGAQTEYGKMMAEYRSKTE
ncbi:MAG: hypothetical protein IT262_23355 [Saprospiraceae bacterium]|nr:hypothetical protein [Saprospiraceae bacterium]